MGLYLIIMGVQGAGKGTQATVIRDTFNIPHVSTGDLFRAMKTRTDDLAQRVQDIMKSGALVPDDVTNEILQDRVEQPDAGDGVILDGYPRNIDQAKWLESYLTGRGEKLGAALLLELDYYTAFKRAFGRFKLPSTGETYNIYTNNESLEWQAVDHPEKAYPARLEVKHKASGEALTRRADDEAASVIKRIDTFQEQTAPLIAHYDAKDLLIRIQADQPIDAVGNDIKAAIEAIVAKS